MIGKAMIDQELTLAETQFGLDPGSFPYESRLCPVGGAKLRYVDEGSGPTLFMLHGNPTWSFVYRHLIEGLRNDYRCVAVDMAGFGLSEPPEDFSFKPAAQADLITSFLEAVDLRDATLIAHDWGGPVGIAAMTRTEGRITRLCLGNTWLWPVNGQFHYEWFSRFMGGPIGKFNAEKFALFVNFFMPTSVKRRKLTKQEMQAYRAPFANGRSRTPMHVFPREITGSGAWLGQLSEKIPQFEGPIHFVWPEKDIAFRKKELNRWLTMLPHASHDIIENCGHYLWEEAPEDCLASIRTFLSNSGP